MKRLWLFPVIFVIALLSYPLLSFADYIIHLNSGRKFVTERYWEEGGEIKFHFKSGVLGVPKTAVVSIEEFTPEAPATDAALSEEKKETKKVGEEVKANQQERRKEG